MEKYKVIFYPDNKTVEAERGKTILSVAISAGIYINSSCGGEGVCGKCKIIVRKGSVLTQPTGRITPEEKKRNVFLACLTTIEGDLEVEIPEQSRLTFEKITPQELEESRLKGMYSLSEEISVSEQTYEAKLFKHSPLATKLYLELPPPSLEDRISDLERLYRAIREVCDIPIIQTGLVNIRRLGHLLREAEWKVTVTLGKRNGTTEVVLIEPGNTSDKNFGVCFDIGTTTITGQLIDLNNKKILSTKSSYNKQATFGSDIITRIIFACREDGLEKLHHAVIDTMNEMIQTMISENNIDLNNLNCVLCAGNTTMIHLLLKIDPCYIRKEPYIPTANFVPTIRAAEAGIKINPRGLLSCIPGVSSYVGGDVVAGVLASGIYKEEGLCLLIDIGTNGEIVLGNREFLISCAASAGPAFEGGGLTSGMRAAKGAIQQVEIKPDNYEVKYETIAEGKPLGICGSGYINILSELLRCGLIDRNGKFSEIKNKNLRQGTSGKEFLLVPKEKAQTQTDIVITEVDIENIKCAKSAIYAGTATLLKHMNLDFSQIKKVFIAGGFGTSIDIDKAINIGLLPDLDRSCFIFIGNSSLTGARMAILSYEALEKAKEIAKKITYLELSAEPGYMEEYVAGLFFPHTDLKRFPSVRY